MDHTRIPGGGFTERMVLPPVRKMRVPVMSPVVCGDVVSRLMAVLAHGHRVHLLWMMRLASAMVIMRVMSHCVASVRRNHRGAQILATTEDLLTPVAVTVEEPAASATCLRNPDVRIAPDEHDVTIVCRCDIDIVALGYQLFVHNWLRRSDGRTCRCWRGHDNARMRWLRGDRSRRGGHASPEHERARDSGDREDPPHIVQAMLRLTVEMIPG